MSICCSDLLKLKYFQEIKLIAGEKGLYREISWPFICTTTTINQWVNGGELIFIIGVGIKSDEESLLLLMQECIEKNLSGMVILKGDYYIHSIPASLIDLSNQLSFPLFEMPWTLKLIDVTQEISQRIIEYRNQSKKHIQFLERLLFSDSTDQSFEELSLRKDIVPRLFRFIALIDIEHPFNQDLELIKSDIARTLENHTKKKTYEVICIGHNNTVICLGLADTYGSVSKLNSSIVEAFHILEKRYPHVILKLGFGKNCQNKDNIRQSYIEAKKVIMLMNHNLLSNNYFHYKDVGIFRLLFEIKDTDKIKDYCTENIGKLTEIDQKNNSELLKTLYYYLINNCNLLKTSKVLFIHRNTLIYRLNLISDIIEKNLDDAHVLHELYLSIIAAEFLKTLK